MFNVDLLIILFIFIFAIVISLFILKKSSKPINKDKFSYNFPLGFIGLFRNFGLFKFLPKEEYLLWKVGFDLIKNKKNFLFQLNSKMFENKFSSHYFPLRSQLAKLLSIKQLIAPNDKIVKIYIEKYSKEKNINELWVDFNKLNNKLPHIPNQEFQIYVNRHFRYCEGAILDALCNSKTTEAYICLYLWLKFFEIAQEKISINEISPSLNHIEFFKKVKKLMIMTHTNKNLKRSSFLSELGSFYLALRNTQNLIKNFGEGLCAK